MPSRSSYGVAILLAALLAPWSTAAETFDTYREFTLRDSTAAVVARARAIDRELKTLHDRPALLQELTWRPPSTIGTTSTERDSVETIVFSFLDNQLFKMEITYNRSKTEGLTKQDLIDSLSAVYGQRSTPSSAARRPASDSLDTATPLATWRQGDTTITLTEAAYLGEFGLVVSSGTLETAARKAQTTAATMDAREAPAREAARAKAEADAARAAGAKVRSDNKAGFQP